MFTDSERKRLEKVMKMSLGEIRTRLWFGCLFGGIGGLGLILCATQFEKGEAWEKTLPVTVLSIVLCVGSIAIYRYLLLIQRMGEEFTGGDGQVARQKAGDSSSNSSSILPNPSPSSQGESKNQVEPK